MIYKLRKLFLPLVTLILSGVILYGVFMILKLRRNLLPIITLVISGIILAILIFLFGNVNIQDYLSASTELRSKAAGLLNIFLFLCIWVVGIIFTRAAFVISSLILKI